MISPFEGNCETRRRRILILFFSDYLSDVTFVLGDGELKAHKFFLMTASPVFHEIFTAQLDTPFDLKIEGIAKETMLEICRYAYTEQIKLTVHNMLPLLYASSKLQMKFLTEKIINFICKDGMNDKTVFAILKANEKESNMVINMKCYSFIEKNYQKCFNSSDFLVMSSDLIRSMLQTCKFNQTAAKKAIALWSSQEDNKDEDLDELIALVSLNEDVPEISGDPEYKSSETVSSHPRARSVGRGNPPGPRQNMNKNLNKNFHGSNQSLDSPNQKNFRHHQRVFGPKQVESDLAAVYANMLQRQHQQMQQSRDPTKNVLIIGRIVRKKDKFANLDLNVFTKTIAITQLHFVYDLRTTDSVFDFRIADVQSRVDLYSEQVQTNANNGPFFVYNLSRPCVINAGSKVWISLGFAKAEHRISFADFQVDRSTADRVGLRTPSHHSQVISTIVFVDC